MIELWVFEVSLGLLQMIDYFTIDNAAPPGLGCRTIMGFCYHNVAPLGLSLVFSDWNFCNYFIVIELRGYGVVPWLTHFLQSPGGAVLW